MILTSSRSSQGCSRFEPGKSEQPALAPGRFPASVFQSACSINRRLSALRTSNTNEDVALLTYFRLRLQDIQIAKSFISRACQVAARLSGFGETPVA